VATGFDADRVVMENPLINRISTVAKSSQVGIGHSSTTPSISIRKEINMEKTTQEDEDDIIESAMAFSSRKILEPKMIIEEKIQPRIDNTKIEKHEDSDDDELEIPAFIRRKMEK
jgi:hypothetical protein